MDLGQVRSAAYVRLQLLTAYKRDGYPGAMTTRVAAATGMPPDELSFRFLSGRLSLDFCATVGERWRGNFERLRTPQDLARWCAEAGVTADLIPVTAEDLRQARTLREAIYRTAKALIAGGQLSRGDEDIINSSAAHPPLIPIMRGTALTWLAPEHAAAAALSVVARDAISLLTGPQRHRIRECASSQCGLLFVDLSRPGQRRWCSSNACGGKARAAAYRQRKSHH